MERNKWYLVWGIIIPSNDCESGMNEQHAKCVVSRFESWSQGNKISIFEGYLQTSKSLCSQVANLNSGNKAVGLESTVKVRDFITS